MESRGIVVCCFRRLLLPVMFIYILHDVCSVNATTQQALSKALYDDLMADYDSSLIPLCTSDSKVTLNMDIAVRQIMDMNERDQILETNLWIRLGWTDCRMTWDPVAYNNLTYLMVSYSTIWVPDISLYDSSAEGDMLPGVKNSRAYISYNGSVAYNFPTVVKTICRVNVRYFPFDEQTCPLKFGSWSHHGLDLDVVNRNLKGDIDYFIEGTEWTINDIPVKRHVLYYNCCPEPYPDVTFYVIMKRRPTFYILTLIFPYALTAAMPALGFLLPVESGEKVSLQITVLLSLAVFFLIVSESLPPSSDNFPIIGTYFACTMILVSVSLVQTVIVINVFCRGTNGRTVPRWARFIFFRCIGRVLCVRYKAYNTVEPVEKMWSDITVESTGYNDKVELVSTEKCHNDINHNYKHTNAKAPEKRMNNFSINPTNDGMTERSNCTRKMTAPFNDRRQNTENVELEWRELANVLDIIFLILYTLIMLITSLKFLLQCKGDL